MAGKVVVITGASSGMGKELAFRYAKRRAKIVIAARRLEELEKVKAGIVQATGNLAVLPVKCDVSDESQAEALVEATIAEYGHLDVLVLCAGISAHSNFEDFETLEPFRKVVDVNLYGCVYPTRYALPHLKMAGKGQILVLSSFSGEYGLPHRSCYSASKFAVNGFFESLRMELGDKIDITVVSPITVDTGFRNYSLIKPKKEASESKSVVSAADAVTEILMAADKRMEKHIFPYKSWIAVKYRYFAPKTFAGIVKKNASL
uniref:Uncharacterized protein n=1 Tax=Strombidium inclinatum TaxID=197538 RepID=A0A7S3IIM9_9SPIT